MTLIDEVRHLEAKDRAKHLATYRDLLRRHADPRPGDGAKLRSTMDALGITSARLDADLAALKRHDELAERATWTEQDEAACVKAAEDSEKHREAMVKTVRALEDEQLRLSGEAGSWRAKAGNARTAREDLQALRERRADLFGSIDHEQGK